MEKWRKIGSFNGYWVSDQGRVKTEDFNHTKKEGLLKLFKNVNGYMCCNLMVGGVRKRETVHQLVGRAFIDNPDNLRQLNHISGVKTDNRAVNLEWCTAKHNTLHSIRNGLGKNNRKQSQLTESERNAILVLMANEVDFQIITKSFGISYHTLKRLKNGVN